jgi:hypothetical protein
MFTPAGVELTANDLPPAAPGSNVGVTVAPVGEVDVGGTDVEVGAPPVAVGTGVLVRAVAVIVLVAVGVNEGPAVAVDVGWLVAVGGLVTVSVAVPPTAWFTVTPVVDCRIESNVSLSTTSLFLGLARLNVIDAGEFWSTLKVIVISVNGPVGAGTPPGKSAPAT